MFLQYNGQAYNINSILSFEMNAFISSDNTFYRVTCKKCKTHGETFQKSYSFWIKFVDGSSKQITTNRLYDSYPEYEKHFEEIKTFHTKLKNLIR